MLSEITTDPMIAARTGMRVCPAKAGVFSGKQSHQGNSQDPCSLDSQEEGN
jgi:hypothetical protein